MRGYPDRYYLEFDPAEGLFSPMTVRYMNADWPSLFRSQLLAVMPAKELAERFDPIMGAPTKELYSMAGFIFLKEHTHYGSDENVEAAHCVPLSPGQDNPAPPLPPTSVSDSCKGSSIYYGENPNPTPPSYPCHLITQHLPPSEPLEWDLSWMGFMRGIKSPMKAKSFLVLLYGIPGTLLALSYPASWGQAKDPKDRTMTITGPVASIRPLGNNIALELGGPWPERFTVVIDKTDLLDPLHEVGRLYIDRTVQVTASVYENRGILGIVHEHIPPPKGYTVKREFSNRDLIKRGVEGI